MVYISQESWVRGNRNKSMRRTAGASSRKFAPSPAAGELYVMPLDIIEFLYVYYTYEKEIDYHC